MYSLAKFESETFSIVLDRGASLLGRKALEQKEADDRYSTLGEVALLRMANHGQPFDGHFEHDIFCMWVDSGADIPFKAFLLDYAGISVDPDNTAVSESSLAKAA